MTARTYRTFNKSKKATSRAPVQVLRRKGKPDLPVPKEYIEQRGLFKMRDAYLGAYPDLSKLFAVPNGGSRGDPSDPSNREGMNLKLEGVTPGVPDTQLPVSRLGYHGCWVEMKRVAFGLGVKWGTFGDGQIERLRELRADGHYATVASGYQHAINIYIAYLSSNQKELDKLDMFEDYVAHFQKQAPKSLAPHLRTP